MYNLFYILQFVVHFYEETYTNMKKNGWFEKCTNAGLKVSSLAETEEN